MTCGGCGNTKAFRTRTFQDGTEFCDRCGQVGTPWVPDVYWDGKPEINLPDGPDGKPRVFGSKVEKAVFLKQHGLVEAGDKIRGGYGVSRPIEQKSDSALRALQKVKEMGKDVRRQEYLRILHERKKEA